MSTVTKVCVISNNYRKINTQIFKLNFSEIKFLYEEKPGYLGNKFIPVFIRIKIICVLGNTTNHACHMKNEHKLEYASKSGEDLKPKHGTQQTLKLLFQTKDGTPLPEVRKHQIESALEGYIIDSDLCSLLNKLWSQNITPSLQENSAS